MKGQTYLILSIIFIIIISVFAVLNISEVEVNYLFWSGSSPLIFVILFSVLLGGVLTMFVGSRKFFQLKLENKKLRKRLTSLEAEQINEEPIKIETKTENNQEINE